MLVNAPNFSVSSGGSHHFLMCFTARTGATCELHQFNASANLQCILGAWLRLGYLRLQPTNHWSSRNKIWVTTSLWVVDVNPASQSDSFQFWPTLNLSFRPFLLKASISMSTCKRKKNDTTKLQKQEEYHKGEELYDRNIQIRWWRFYAWPRSS